MRESSPILLTRRALRKLEDAYSNEMESLFGKNKRPSLALTLPQYFTLRAIARFDTSPSQTDLVEATGIDRSTMADVIRRLRKKGYITRARRSSDARTYAIRVAEEGAKIMATVKPIVDRVEEMFLGQLPAKQREAFLAAIERMAFLETDAAAEQQKRAA